MPGNLYNTEIRSDSANVSTTSAQILNLATQRRTSFVITNTSATAVVSLNFGEGAAVANTGVVLQPTQSYGQSDDSAFSCYQGKIQAIASGSGTVAISEQHQV